MSGVNLCSIRWFDDGHGRAAAVVGDLESIMALAHTLENAKVGFKIAVCGFEASTQKMFGVGGFSYWLKPDDPLQAPTQMVSK